MEVCALLLFQHPLLHPLLHAHPQQLQGFTPRQMGSFRQKSVNKQLSNRQKFHLGRLKKPKSPGEMGQVSHSEATHQRVIPEKLMAPLRVNSHAADANTSVLAVRYLSRSHTANTAALI